MTVKYKSERLEVIHKTAEGFFEIGLITKERMKEYDDICLVKEVRRAKRGGESGCPHTDSQKQTHKQTRQARVSAKQTQLEQTA